MYILALLAQTMDGYKRRPHAAVAILVAAVAFAPGCRFNLATPDLLKSSQELRDGLDRLDVTGVKTLLAENTKLRKSLDSLMVHYGEKLYGPGVYSIRGGDIRLVVNHNEGNFNVTAFLDSATNPLWFAAPAIGGVQNLDPLHLQPKLGQPGKHTIVVTPTLNDLAGTGSFAHNFLLSVQLVLVDPITGTANVLSEVSWNGNDARYEGWQSKTPKGPKLETREIPLVVL